MNQKISLHGAKLTGALRSTAIAMLWLLVNYLVAWAIILVGETVFRGWPAAVSWLRQLPAASLLSAAFITLWLLALQTLFTRRASWSFAALFFMAYSLANVAKVSKLNTPITPSDMLLVGQWVPAVRMAWGIVPVILAGAAMLLAGWALWRRREKLLRQQGSPKWLTIMLGLASAITAVLLVTQPDYSLRDVRSQGAQVAEYLDDIGIRNTNWSATENTATNGQLLAFLMNVQPALVGPPLDYSRPEVDRILAGLPKESAPNRLSAKVDDVIVIMSEAWWDPTRLPGTRYADPLFQALDATSQGTLLSPTFGGYTANTEFEFLSRLSNANLPAGSIPYEQYLTHRISALPWDFLDAGYATTAIHPFDGKFWNRSKAYPLMGFKRFITELDFNNPERTPPYISDRQLAKKIIEVAASNRAQRNFIFAVSMQNHGAYYDGATRYSSSTRVSAESDMPQVDAATKDTLSTYATGVRDAVAAFNTIVAEYKKSNRKAIILMFGDHLPFLGDNFDAYTKTGYISSADKRKWAASDREKMHSVPVVAWTNTGQDFPLPQDPTSPIYLGTALKRASGVELSPMDKLLHQVFPEASALSRFYNAKPSGEVYASRPSNDGPLGAYSLISYDQLLGAGYSTCALRISACSEPASAGASHGQTP